MRIAVIGSGIAGNAAAWALTVGSAHEVTVYEREVRPGGHSATVDVACGEESLPVDLGFIVYNEPNYPNLTRLLRDLGVETRESDMSFSVSDAGGRLTWTSRPAYYLGPLAGSAPRLPAPVHLRVLKDLVRFNGSAMRDLHAGRVGRRSLGAYLEAGGYSRRFREDYLVAMGSAIWSMPPGRMLDFPAESFLAFFENHRLLRLPRPAWRTVVGGSRAYVERLTAPFRPRLRLGTPVAAVRRTAEGVEVVEASGARQVFDQVVLACHTDQALALLDSPTERERLVLGRIPYQANAVHLHRDPALMPRRREAWAAWNVLRGPEPEDPIAVTYWMNALQGLDERFPLFVSLNPPRPPREDLAITCRTFEHPVFDRAALDAQGALPSIQGADRVWFCGAWATYGFHEDGLTAGLQVAEALGAALPWRLAPRQLVEDAA